MYDADYQPRNMSAKSVTFPKDIRDQFCLFLPAITPVK